MKARSPSKRDGRGIEEEIEMVRRLEGTGRYRILRKLQPRSIADAPRSSFPLRGVIVDTETTGLNARKDEIIEIGMVAFSFDEAGNIGDVTDVCGGLQQPSVAISADITRLTSITDAMVAGQTIDVARAQALIEPADLIIAHNAGFDRPFCETSPGLSRRRHGLVRSPRLTGRRGVSKERSLATLSGRQATSMTDTARSTTASHCSRSWPRTDRSKAPHPLPNSSPRAGTRGSASLPSIVPSR